MNSLPFIKQNLEALAEVKNPAAIWLAQQSPDEQAVMDNITTNERWKLLDWKLPEQGKTLFEAFHPAMHYRGWKLDNKKDGACASIIVGCNLGYGLNHVVVNSHANHLVLVVEPDPAMLLACLGQSDYSPFIRAGKLHFLPPHAETIRRALQKLDMHFLFGSIHLRKDVPSLQLGPQYAQWVRFCQETLENISVELATLRLQQDTMVRNELQNYKPSLENGSVKSLANTAKGLTAVLLGAGPSLEKIGPSLAADRGHALYVSSLQTLPALARIGLKPDLVMAIDYTKGMLRVYNQLDEQALEWIKDVPLLYSTKVDPEVIRRYPGPTIPFWTMGGLGTYTMPKDEKPLDAGGNVSVALYRLLHQCGVSRFLLCGQDFAWKGAQSHSGGHHAASTKKKRTMEIKNLDGETLTSALPYVVALRDMERDIKKTGLPTFNIYGGYGVIKGARHVDIQQVKSEGLNMSAPGSLHRFKNALERAKAPCNKPPIEPRYPKWASSLRNAQRHMEKLFKKPQTRQKEIHEAVRRFHHYLRHDPMYMPYLYNEIMDVAGLIHGGRTLEAKDLTTFKKIIKRVQIKVRDMDSLVADLEFKEHMKNSRNAA